MPEDAAVAVRAARREHVDRALERVDVYLVHRALIVESERDSVIPQQVVANYRAAFTTTASLTVRVLDEADHSLSTDEMQKTYTTVLVAWLKEMIGRARKDSQTTPVIAVPAPAPTAAD